MPAQLAVGPHALRASDDHSEYPVTYTVTIE